MKTANNDVFANMKNEDRKFGDRGGKSVVGTDKQNKHRAQVNYSNMRVSDLLSLSEDNFEDEDDLQVA